MREIEYVSPSGAARSLDEPDMALVGTGAGVRGWRWAYKVGSDDIEAVRRGPYEASLTFTLPSMGAARALLDAFDADMAGPPGSLRVDGEWTQRARFPKGEVSAVNVDGSVVVDASVVLLDGAWGRTEKVELMPRALSRGTDLDLPADAPYDLGATRAGATLSVPGPAPCPVRITVWGQAVRPRVTIAGNLYAFDATVPAGSRLVADGTGRRKTIEIVSEAGDAVDAFDTGWRGSGPGGGSYCFEPLPPGDLAVSYDGTFGVTVEYVVTRGGLP